jgi:hypothetical protein
MGGKNKMNVYNSVKYPCGYSQELEASSGFLDFGAQVIEFKMEPCPLHGKDCPPHPVKLERKVRVKKEKPLVSGKLL